MCYDQSLFGVRQIMVQAPCRNPSSLSSLNVQVMLEVQSEMSRYGGQEFKRLF